MCGDEPFSIFHAAMAPGEIVRELLKGNNPPLYEVLLHFWTSAWGYGTVAVRSFSVVLMFAGWLAFLPIAKALQQKHLLWILPIVFTFSELLFMRNIEARMYPLLLATVTWSWAAWIQLKATRKIKWAVILGVALGVSLYVHYLALFHIATIGVVTLLFISKAWKQKIVAGLLTLLLTLPLLILIFSKSSGYQNDHWLEVEVSTKNFLLYGFSIWNHAIVIAGLGLIFLVDHFMLKSEVVKKLQSWLWPLLIYFGVVYIIMWGATLYQQPVIFDRYLAFISIASALFVAFVLVHFWQYQKWIFAGLLVLFILPFDFTPWNHRNCEDWVNTVSLHEDEVVVISPPWHKYSFIYHKMPELMGFKATEIDSILNLHHVYPIYEGTPLPDSVGQYRTIIWLSSESQEGNYPSFLRSYDTTKSYFPELMYSVKFQREDGFKY